MGYVSTKKDLAQEFIKKNRIAESLKDTSLVASSREKVLKGLIEFSMDLHISVSCFTDSEILERIILMKDIYVAFIEVAPEYIPCFKVLLLTYDIRNETKGYISQIVMAATNLKEITDENWSIFCAKIESLFKKDIDYINSLKDRIDIMSDMHERDKEKINSLEAENIELKDRLKEGAVITIDENAYKLYVIELMKAMKGNHMSFQKRRAILDGISKAAFKYNISAHDLMNYCCRDDIRSENISAYGKIVNNKRLFEYLKDNEISVPNTLNALRLSNMGLSFEEVIDFLVDDEAEAYKVMELIQKIESIEEIDEMEEVDSGDNYESIPQEEIYDVPEFDTSEIMDV